MSIIKRAQKELDEKNKVHQTDTSTQAHQVRSVIRGSYNQWIRLSGANFSRSYEKIIADQKIIVHLSNQLNPASGTNVTTYMFSTICLQELGQNSLIDNVEEAIFTIVYLWVHTPMQSGVVILESLYVVVDNPAREKQVLVVSECRAAHKITYLNESSIDPNSNIQKTSEIAYRDATLRELQTIEKIIKAIDHRSEAEKPRYRVEEMEEIECL